MKMSLQIDDDVYAAAERRASAENRSVGEILSELARKGLDADRGQFPVFSVSNNSRPITLEMVKTALDDDI